MEKKGGEQYRYVGRENFIIFVVLLFFSLLIGSIITGLSQEFYSVPYSPQNSFESCLWECKMLFSAEDTESFQSCVLVNNISIEQFYLACSHVGRDEIDRVCFDKCRGVD